MSQSRTNNGPPPFGRYVKAAIAGAGFRSPTAFARATGHDPSVVLRWISGQTKPSPQTLANVAPTLKVSATELIGAAYPDLPAGPAVEPEPAPHLANDPANDPASKPADDPADLNSLAWLARQLHRDNLPLLALIHRSGLGEADRLRLVLKIRARWEAESVPLLEDIAADIEAAGGTVPERVWPPDWLVEK